MHYLLRLIVRADNTEDAISEAHSVMEDLVDWHEFDWYQTSIDDSRWPDCWSPVKVSSKKGAAWIKDAMTSQYEEFKRTMQSVQHMVENYSDEQIYEEQFEQTAELYLSRWRFNSVAGRGNQVFDADGSTIHNQHYLGLVTKDTDDLWVVQVDAHN